MPNQRRRKQRRITLSAAIFLDLEAQEDQAVLSDEEVNSDDDQFIVPDEPEDGSQQREYSRRLLALAEEGQPRLEPQPHPRALDHPQVMDAAEGTLDLIGGLSAGIWEMHCVFGREQYLVDHVRTIVRGVPGVLPQHSCVVAVDWSRLLRGRIFMEVSDGARGKQMNYLFQALNTFVRPPFSRRRFFPFQGLDNWLNALATPTADTFTRIRTPNLYRGDVGYILSQNGALYVALVPRIPLSRNLTGARPPRQALTPSKARLSRNPNDIVDVHKEQGSFTFQGNQLTLEGYLLLPVESVKLFPEANICPSLEELERFKDLVQMPASVIKDYRLGNVQRRLSGRDRVWVMCGESRGKVGIIMHETDTAQVQVYIPDEDAVETVLLEDLRAHFAIGDPVTVQYGNHKGTIGFVMRIEDDEVTVVNPDAQLEVTTLVEYVFFHELPPQRHLVSDLKFEIGDEVVVHRGPDQGLQGVVEAVHNTVLVIREGEFYPPKFEVLLNSLRLLSCHDGVHGAFGVGDEVEVVDGEHKGRVGTICTIYGTHSALIKEGPSEPHVCIVNSAFVNHTATPKRNDLLLALQTSHDQEDPYRGLMGYACCVRTGSMKGYRCWVVDTHPSGLITVRFEARLQQVASYSFTDLAFHKDHPHLEPLSAPSGPERSSTPPWSDPLEPPGSPAWDPAAPPIIAPVVLDPPEPYDLPEPRWLLEEMFRNRRIYLRDSFGEGYVGEFMGVRGTERILFKSLQGGSPTPSECSIATLRHVTPKYAGDLVIPIEGMYKGRVMRVRELGQDESTLTEVGKRNTSKTFVRPTVRNSLLARIVSAS